MKAAGTLRAMIRAFENDHFCTGRSARNARGEPCDPRDPGATSWCTVGIIARECTGDWALEAEVKRVVRKAARELFGHSYLTPLNDSPQYGKDAMIVVFRRALKTIERESVRKEFGKFIDANRDVLRELAAV